MSDLPRTPADVVAHIDSQRRPRPAIANSLVPPQNPMEAAIAAFWCEALRFNEVGIHDDFFDLGGDSIRMVRILSRIWKCYDVEIPIEVFFDNPTVASLVHIIEDALGKNPASAGGEGDTQRF